MDQVIDSSLYLLAQYFPALMYVSALIVATIIVSTRRQGPQRRHNINTFIAYTMLFAIGFAGIWNAILHIMMIRMQPFEYQLALMYFAFGISGVCAFQSSHGFRLATTVMFTILLWGIALMQLYNNFSTESLHHSVFENISFYYNIIVPANLIILLRMHRKYKNHVFS